MDATPQHSPAVGTDLGEHEVVIVGAGFGGLCMASKLCEAGRRDFLVLEKGTEIGGTWRDNSYPGAACDVRSHVYSYSFAPNPDWSQRFAPRAEIKAYIEGVAQSLKLAPFIRFQQEVVAARWDATHARWELRTRSGHSVRARHFVLSCGVVHKPHIPALPGLARFEGKVFHSACWDHNYDLTGKRVASIGTGASAVQYLPQIAPRVSALHVFQRSPGWVVPRSNRRYSRFERWLYRRFGFLRRLHRARLYWINEASLLAALHLGLAKLAGRVARAFIRRSVRDPALQKALTPDYPFGCKRILISSDYLGTFNRANVSLVTEEIAEIRPGSIVARDGVERTVDCLILGTGFATDPRVYTEHLACEGIAGLTLRDAWKHGAQAYLGVSVPGFPNMFQLAGPNSVLAHNSLLLMLEAQADYVIACLAQLELRSAQSMVLRTEALEAYNTALKARFSGTVWVAGCASWYKHEDGQNFSLWPGSAWRFWLQTRRVNADHYEWQR